MNKISEAVIHGYVTLSRDAKPDERTESAQTIMAFFDRVARAMAVRPGLPVMAKYTSTPMGDDQHLPGVRGAYVDALLDPGDVRKTYGSSVGISDWRFKSEDYIAVTEVMDFLFEHWYHLALEHGMSPAYGRLPSAVLTEFCGSESDIGAFCEELATHMVEDMPWQEYIFVECQ